MAQTSVDRADRAAGKARLDRDSIVAATLELAATPGVTSISFRELGAHLGADPTAVYRHFRNKEELMRALLEHLTQETLAGITAPAEDWRERLRQISRKTFEGFERYPAIGVEAFVLTTNGPAEHGAMETILDAFARAGLEGDDLVRHYALFAGHVLTAGANIARLRAEREDEGSGLWLDVPLRVDPHEFPHVARNAGLLSRLTDEEMYLAGVEMFIESAERTAAAS